jgi:hypothetical protein
MPAEMVNVRYMVDNVEAAVAWYTTHLGFRLLSNQAPAFADVARGSLRLLLSGSGSSAGRAMPDGERPSPAAGTAFISSWTTFRPKSRGCALLACASATMSSRVPAGRKSSSSTLPETLSSFSSRRGGPHD